MKMNVHRREQEYLFLFVPLQSCAIVILKAEEQCEISNFHVLTDKSQ